MVARNVFVKGLGQVDLLSGIASAPPSSGDLPLVAVAGDLSSAAVSDPIVREDMWAFTGANVSQGGGSYSNFLSTSVIQSDGPGGASSKILNQDFPSVVSGSTSNYAAPPTGTGITLTSAILAGGPVEEATIEYDWRCKTVTANSGPPWGWGGKLPGLAGARSGFSVPTGGNPSPNGFSARLMFRRQGTRADANLQAKLVGYFYSPDLPPGAIGNDLTTGKTVSPNTWYHIKQYHKVNTVTTEGSTSPPADGIHRIWLNGVLCYESTTTVYRFYTEAMINRLCWDNFYGGNDASDGAPWGPATDAVQQFDNLLIRTS